MLGQNEAPHLVGDQVLADGQRHLDGVGFVRDRDGVHLELVFAVQSVGLAHRLLKHLLVALLAQHGPDVHQPRFTAAAGHRAALQHGEEQHAAQLHWGGGRGRSEGRRTTALQDENKPEPQFYTKLTRHQLVTPTEPEPKLGFATTSGRLTVLLVHILVLTDRGPHRTFDTHTCRKNELGLCGVLLGSWS